MRADTLRSTTSVLTPSTSRRAFAAVAMLAFVACSVEEQDPSSDTAATVGQPLAVGEYSLFSATSAPRVSSDADSSAVEIGVRFKADSDGAILGISFYKGAGNTGAHAAHLWSEAGALLKTQTFGAETSSGWQTVRFASPVAVKAGQYYVASYHTDAGHYAGDNGYFAGRSVDSGPLHAPADTTTRHNGVFHYGASAFPRESWSSSNYWVDVVFKPAPAPVADAGTPPPATDAGTTTPPDAGSGSTVTHGSDITAANTGVPAGVVLTPQSGGVTLDTAGAVFQGKDLTGSIYVSADNVTIRNCKIRSSDYFAIRHASGKNLLVENCEIWSPAGAYTGIAGGNMTVRRNNIHNFENGIVVESSALVEENYIHDLYYGPGAHVDGVEWGSSGDNTIIRRNHITLGGDTGCVNLTPWGGGAARNNSVVDNLFAGGTYSLYIRGDGGGTVSGVTVTGNVWVKGSYAYGPVSLVAASGITWSNNKLSDGTVVNQ